MASGVGKVMRDMCWSPERKQSSGEGTETGMED